MVRTLQNKIRKKMALPPKAGRRTMRAKALARWAMRQFDYKLYGKCLEILSNWPRGGKALQRMILERPGIVLAREGQTRGTLLHYAVSYRPGFVVALLEAGADPNARGTPYRNWTPLFYATKNRKHGASVVSCLLEHGADPHAKNAEGETALHFAARHNNGDICKLLIAAGSDVDARDNKAQKALEIAVKHTAPECVAILLAAGAKVTRNVAAAAMWWGSPGALQILFRAEPCCVHWVFDWMHRSVRWINIEYLNRIRKAAIEAQFMRPCENPANDVRFACSVSALISNAPIGLEKVCANEFAGYEAYERDQRRGLANIVRRHVVGHRVPAEIGDIIVEFWGHPGGYVVF